MQDYRQKSFWLGQLDIEPNPTLRGEHRYDVAIIGGGFTGISTAYFLKTYDPSLEVCVLEKEVVGFGASGRNAGFSMTLFGMTMGLTALRFGRDNAAEAHHYMNEAVDLVRELVDEHDIDCDYEHNGFLRVATSRAYEKRLRKELELVDELGLDGLHWMGPDELAAQVRSPLFRGAVWEPNCGLVNPAKLVRGMKAVVEELGVDVFEHTEVTDIDRGASPTAQTTDGRVHADKIVLATNAYSRAFPAIRSRQVPVFTHIVLTEPLEERHFDEIGWRHRQGLEDARNMIHYFRLTPDNRLLMGGSDVSVTFGNHLDGDLNERVFETLEADIAAMFPPLADLDITHRWGGPVSITLDMAPAIGFAGSKDIVYSVGCIGHGVSLTHLNGKTIAELLLGRDTERTRTFFVNRTVLPWPPEPLRFAASHALRGYMHLEDALKDP